MKTIKTMLSATIIALLIQCYLLGVVGVYKDLPVPGTEEHLRNFLLGSYHKDALPDIMNNISMRMTIRHFDMNEQLHALELDGWVVMKWHDPRLKWKTEEHDEILKLGVHPDVLWKPDVSLYNNANPNNLVEIFANTNAIVFSSGDVLWVPPAHMKASCVMDLTYWPYDTHNCSVKFGSWIYSGLQVNLQLMDNKPNIDLTELYEEGRNLTRGSWHLVDSIMVRSTRFYDCCPNEPYIDIRVIMTIKRNAPTFLWTVQMPVVVLCLMTIVVFLLPPGAKEKILFGGLCLILDIIFLDYVATVTEASPSHPPLIVKLTSVQVILTAASILACAVVTRFVHAPYCTELPHPLKRVVNTLAACLFIASYRRESPNAVTGFTRSTMKGEDVEINEGAAHLYPDGKTHDTSNDWTVFGAVIDRFFLIIYSFIFVLNMLSFISVL